MNGDASVWTFVQRSRQAVLGLGLLALGLLFMAMTAEEFFRRESNARWTAGVGLFILLLGTLLARASWRRAKRQLRIAREGIETEATVTAVHRARLQPTGSRYDLSTRGGTQIIRYSYVDKFGGTHQGKSGYLPFDQAKGWKPGDRGAVRFDPEDPAESVWMALVGESALLQYLKELADRFRGFRHRFQSEGGPQTQFLTQPPPGAPQSTASPEPAGRQAELTPQEAKSLKDLLDQRIRGLQTDPEILKLMDIMIREGLGRPLLARGYKPAFVNTAPISELARIAAELRLLE